MFDGPQSSFGINLQAGWKAPAISGLPLEQIPKLVLVPTPLPLRLFGRLPPARSNPGCGAGTRSLSRTASLAISLYRIVGAKCFAISISPVRFLRTAKKKGYLSAPIHEDVLCMANRIRTDCCPNQVFLLAMLCPRIRWSTTDPIRAAQPRN